MKLPTTPVLKSKVSIGAVGRDFPMGSPFKSSAHSRSECSRTASCSTVSEDKNWISGSSCGRYPLENAIHSMSVSSINDETEPQYLDLYGDEDFSSGSFFEELWALEETQSVVQGSASEQPRRHSKSSRSSKSSRGSQSPRSQGSSLKSSSRSRREKNNHLEDVLESNDISNLVFSITSDHNSTVSALSSCPSTNIIMLEPKVMSDHHEMNDSRRSSSSRCHKKSPHTRSRGNSDSRLETTENKKSSRSGTRSGKSSSKVAGSRSSNRAEKEHRQNRDRNGHSKRSGRSRVVKAEEKKESNEKCGFMTPPSFERNASFFDTNEWKNFEEREAPKSPKGGKSRVSKSSSQKHSRESGKHGMQDTEDTMDVISNLTSMLERHEVAPKAPSLMMQTTCDAVYLPNMVQQQILIEDVVMDEVLPPTLVASESACWTFSLDNIPTNKSKYCPQSFYPQVSSTDSDNQHDAKKPKESSSSNMISNLNSFFDGTEAPAHAAFLERQSTGDAVRIPKVLQDQITKSSSSKTNVCHAVHAPRRERRTRPTRGLESLPEHH